MTNGTNSRIIKFLDKEYTIDGLEKAIGKANSSYIEPGSKFHEVSFDASKLPEIWQERYKMPIVTVHEGKYVFIHIPDGDKPDPAKGFKAKFVTKYNLNQAKPYVAPPPAPAPVYEAPRTYEKKSYGSKPYQGGGGYNNNRRTGGRDY